MKLTIYIAIVIILITGLSCDENINPVGELRETYLLNCILNGNDSSQIAVLTKNFSEKGSMEISSISGADIRVWFGDSVYVFKEEDINGEEFKSLPIKSFYRSEPFDLNAFNKEVEIEALLPNGKRLTGISKTPDFVFFDDENSVTSIPNENEFFRMQWKGDEVRQYFPRLTIFYSTPEQDAGKLLNIEVPYKMNGETPIYKQPDNSNALIIEKRALDYAMDQLSINISNKSLITIFDAKLEILAFDENMSNYYISTHKAPDAISVQVDQVDFSNINGGLGVFASMVKVEESIKILRNYIESFGYKAGIPD